MVDFSLQFKSLNEWFSLSTEELREAAVVILRAVTYFQEDDSITKALGYLQRVQPMRLVVHGGFADSMASPLSVNTIYAKNTFDVLVYNSHTNPSVGSISIGVNPKTIQNGSFQVKYISRESLQTLKSTELDAVHYPYTDELYFQYSTLFDDEELFMFTFSSIMAELLSLEEFIGIEPFYVNLSHFYQLYPSIKEHLGSTL